MTQEQYIQLRNKLLSEGKFTEVEELDDEFNQ